MKIRRFLGDDCDSVMGFNNGSYIDQDPIEVKDEDEAYAKCKEYLMKNYDIKEEELEEIEGGYEFIDHFFDAETGEEISEEDYESRSEEDPDSVGYKYIYCSFNEDTQ